MSTYRVLMPDGRPTSIVEPDYSAARYMAELLWPGATVVDPREYRSTEAERGAAPEATPLPLGSLVGRSHRPSSPHHHPGALLARSSIGVAMNGKIEMRREHPLNGWQKWVLASVIYWAVLLPLCFFVTLDSLPRVVAWVAMCVVLYAGADHFAESISGAIGRHRATWVDVTDATYEAERRRIIAEMRGWR